MATVRLSRAPVFTTVRATTGAAAADNATINDTNYPVTSAFDPQTSDKVLVQWDGSGTIKPMDYLDLQILYRDGNHSVPRWLVGETKYGVRAKEVAIFNCCEGSDCYIRILGVSTAATAVTIRAARQVD